MIYSKIGPEVQAIFIKYNIIYMYYDEQQCIRMVSKGKSIRLIILYALHLKSAKKSGLCTDIVFHIHTILYIGFIIPRICAFTRRCKQIFDDFSLQKIC